MPTGVKYYLATDERPLLVEPSALALPTVVVEEVELLDVELDEDTVVVVVVVFFFCGAVVESSSAQEERERETHNAAAAIRMPLFILKVFMIYFIRL